ncbi:MAG TPA: metallophosphoesterase family protein [Cyclobacteriaceae bacterium]|nr:metallophosphoesterase family protein [Cyclobacteriaceae bacterium]
MKIGLLSDTHGFLDPKILEYFKDVDEIWHAGDIGDIAVIETLEKVKTVRAVFGNIDSSSIYNRFPEDWMFTCEGVEVWITHIAGSPPRYNERIMKQLRSHPPDLLICGHSHIMKAQRDPQFDNMLYLNPGAAGNHGFHHIKTIVRFELAEGKVQDMQVIELGKRGTIK